MWETGGLKAKEDKQEEDRNKKKETKEGKVEFLHYLEEREEK